MLSTRAKRIRRLTFSVCRSVNENDFVTPFRAAEAALIEATRTRNTSSQLHRFVGKTEQDFNRSGALSVLTLQQIAAPATVDFVRCRAREILPVLYVPYLQRLLTRAIQQSYIIITVTKHVVTASEITVIRYNSHRTYIISG